VRRFGFEIPKNLAFVANISRGFYTSWLWGLGQFNLESSSIRAFEVRPSNAGLVPLIIGCVGVVFCLLVDLVTR